MTAMSVRLEGLEELLVKLDGRFLLATPIRGAFQNIGNTVEAQAKRNASGRPGPKVRTNRLRSSITHRVDNALIPKWVEIGTNVEYAWPLESGHPQEVGRYVPIYGVSRITSGEFKGKYEVTRGLGKRLVKPWVQAYPFLFPALDQSRGKIEGFLGDAAKAIEENFGK